MSLTYRILLIFSLITVTSCNLTAGLEKASQLGETISSPDIVLVSGSYGFSNGSFAKSCLEYIEASNYIAQGSASYWIDPDGDGGAAEIVVYCDMDNFSGGWTMVVSNSSSGSNLSSTDFLNSSFSNEYVDNSTEVISSARTNLEMTEVMFHKVSTSEFHIYEVDSSSLLATPAGSYNLKAGSTPMANNPCSWAQLGTYSSNLLYIGLTDGHRGYMYSPHNNNSNNQCGLFSYSGPHSSHTFFQRGSPNPYYTGEWRIYIK